MNKYKPILNLIGQKFNRLTVLKYAGRTKIRFNVRWLCKCDCGNKLLVTTNRLRSKNTKSCGCLKLDVLSRKARKPAGIASLNRTYRYYKHNSKRKNLLFSLSKKKFKELISMNCFYCGRKAKDFFKRKNDNGKFLYNGLDRINNFRGYTLKNTLPCCRICNRAKSDISFNEFIEHLNGLVNYRKTL